MLFTALFYTEEPNGVAKATTVGRVCPYSVGGKVRLRHFRHGGRVSEFTMIAAAAAQELRSKFGDDFVVTGIEPAGIGRCDCWEGGIDPEKHKLSCGRFGGPWKLSVTNVGGDRVTIERNTRKEHFFSSAIFEPVGHEPDE